MIIKPEIPDPTARASFTEIVREMKHGAVAPPMFCFGPPVDQPRLEYAFEHVRQRYFTRWDPARRWSVVCDADMLAGGRCDIGDKQIRIRPLDQKDENLYSLLIHEISHAQRGCANHGKKWQARLLKAADRAKQLDELHVAALIQIDIRMARDLCGTPLRAPEVYAHIHEAAIDHPDVNYEDLTTMLAFCYRMRRDELEQRFKRCRLAYDLAVRGLKPIRR